jgi:hypothetical protein
MFKISSQYLEEMELIYPEGVAKCWKPDPKIQFSFIFPAMVVNALWVSNIYIFLSLFSVRWNIFLEYFIFILDFTVLFIYIYIFEQAKIKFIYNIRNSWSVQGVSRRTTKVYNSQYTKHILADTQTNKRTRPPHMRIETYICVISFQPPQGVYFDFLEQPKDWWFLCFEDPSISFLPHHPNATEP